MNINNITFPHPVLGIDDNIRSICRFFANPITYNEESYIIDITYEQDNEDLILIINKGWAEYFCEVTCSDTLYRQLFTSQNNQIQFLIPRKNLKGRVDFLCGIYAKNTITEYQNRHAHPDFLNYVFLIQPGDLLAHFGSFHFDAGINYQKLKAVSNFMEIVRNENPEIIHTNIDLNKNKIEVQLPADDYDKFSEDSISKEPKFASIFHSSIVLNSLLIALYNFDSHKGNLWASTIEYRLANDKEFASLNIAEMANIPEIAQKLLGGNPYNRLMGDLKIIARSRNLIDE